MENPRLKNFQSFCADCKFILLKSDWLTVGNEHYGHAQNLGTGQRSGSVGLTKGMAVSGDSRVTVSVSGDSRSIRTKN